MSHDPASDAPPIAADTAKARKVRDVFDNLSLRLGPSRPGRWDAITVDGAHAATVRRAGTPHEAATLALRRLVELLSFTHLGAEAPLGRPAVVGEDPMEPFFDTAMEALAQALGLEPTAPAGRAVVQITHDVDNPQLLTAYQLGRAAVLLARGDRREAAMLRAAGGAVLARLRGRERDPAWRFDTIDALGERHGFRSTFLVFARYPGQHPRDPRYDVTAPRYREVFARLVARGHEVGFHSGINYNSFDADRLRLPQEPPRSHRAHYFAVPAADMERWFDSMARAGTVCDASLSPRTVGTAMGSHYPILFTTVSGRRLTLLPSQFMDAYCADQTTVEALLDTVRVERWALRPVVNLNWHVRTFSGLGPWDGYPQRFDRVLEAVRARMAVDFETMAASAPHALLDGRPATGPRA